MRYVLIRIEIESWGWGVDHVCLKSYSSINGGFLGLPKSCSQSYLDSYMMMKFEVMVIQTFTFAENKILQLQLVWIMEIN